MQAMLQNTVLGFLLFTVTSVPPLLCQAPPKSAKTIQVVRAERAERYGRYPGEVRASEPTDAVLLLEFTGLTDMEWNDIDHAGFFVMANERRCDFKMQILFTAYASRDTDAHGVVPQRKAVFVVPRSRLELTLHVRGYVPIKFKVNEKVKPTLD